MLESLTTLEQLAEQYPGVHRIRDYVVEYTLASMPSHLIRIDTLFSLLVEHTRNIPREVQTQVTREVQIAIATLENKGYRTQALYLTPQEHLIKGSSPGEHEDPYIPVGVQMGQLGIQEVIHARELGVYFLTKNGEFYSVPKIERNTNIRLSLPSLNYKGQTIMDPIPLDEKLRQILIYSATEVPFGRRLR